MSIEEYITRHDNLIDDLRQASSILMRENTTLAMGLKRYADELNRIYVDMGWVNPFQYDCDERGC